MPLPAVIRVDVREEKVVPLVFRAEHFPTLLFCDEAFHDSVVSLGVRGIVFDPVERVA